MLYQTYWKEVNTVLDRVMATQAQKIQSAAELVAKSLARDGQLYVFGCGHSHIIGEDLFYRAGGTAAVCAMLDSDLMLHTGAAKSSVYEKMSGLAQPVFERYGITSNDVILVVSTSGINSVPIEMALCAKEQGVPVIAIASGAYQDDASRHPSGKKLHDVADLLLDNCVCHGDAAVQIGDTDMRVGPISTISSCLIAQSIVVQADEFMHQMGHRPPVYVSGNIPGGMEKNRELIRRYMPRNKHL